MTRAREPASFGWVGWLAPLALLVAVLCGAGVAFAGPIVLFWVVVVALVVLPVAWLVISALFPARAERRCPACGRNELTRLDRKTTVGLVCRACGWRDGTASSWLIAEEEGRPLEKIVLTQRGRGAESSPVDSSPRSG